MVNVDPLIRHTYGSYGYVQVSYFFYLFLFWSTANWGPAVDLIPGGPSEGGWEIHLQKDRRVLGWKRIRGIIGFYFQLPSGKRVHSYGKSLSLAGKSTNFLWAMASSKRLPGRVVGLQHHQHQVKMAELVPNLWSLFSSNRRAVYGPGHERVWVMSQNWVSHILKDASELNNINKTFLLHPFGKNRGVGLVLPIVKRVRQIPLSINQPLGIWDIYGPLGLRFWPMKPVDKKPDSTGWTSSRNGGLIPGDTWSACGSYQSRKRINKTAKWGNT